MKKYLLIIVLLFGILCACSEQKVKKESEAAPLFHSGGSMFPAAQIYFSMNSHPITLEIIKRHMETKIGGEYSLIEWKGFTTTIPQVLIKGSPSWTLQIDNDASYVPEEIKELAEEAKSLLNAKDLAILRSCNARMDAMAYEDQKLPNPKDGRIVLNAATSLDPTNPAVRRVLNEVADLVGGLIYDDVNGKWIPK
jgi:hypothetical protein